MSPSPVMSPLGGPAAAAEMPVLPRPRAWRCYSGDSAC